MLDNDLIISIEGWVHLAILPLLFLLRLTLPYRLPAKKEAPVTITMRGEVFYNSGSLDGPVHDVVIRISATSANEVLPVNVKIPSKHFEEVLDVDLAEGHYLKLGISDTGKGFHMSQHRKLFAETGEHQESG